MTAERERILEMLSEGKITAGDAEQLLGAVEKKRAPLSKWLFSPFELLSTRSALAVAGAGAVAQLLVSQLQVRFDGALDVHVVATPVPAWLALVELALAWPVVALVFLAASRLLARQGRFVDFLGAVGIARIPLVASAVLVGATRQAFLDVEAGAIGPGVVLVGLVLLPLFAWFVTLLVTGLRTASGLRGARLGLAAAGAVVVAEVVTKLALGFIS